MTIELSALIARLESPFGSSAIVDAIEALKRLDCLQASLQARLAETEAALEENALALALIENALLRREMRRRERQVRALAKDQNVNDTTQ